jgi:hypothetical protein
LHKQGENGPATLFLHDVPAHRICIQYKTPAAPARSHDRGDYGNFFLKNEDMVTSAIPGTSPKRMIT